MAVDRAPEQRTAYEMSSQEVETLLQSGQKEEVLRAYFGDARYEELRNLAQQAATRAALRGGPRVLILPGIMGSTIGKRGTLLNDVIWFDPVSIARGDLTKLALGGGRTRVEALDVIPFFYTSLKFRLWWSGFSVDYHFYDWRRSLDELGEQLAQRLENDPADEVYLVAHSMGGLVARAALALGAAKVKRLVMLGTPNYGSFAPVQALRGTYGTVQNVATLDPFHSAEELATRVFSTFPGLYQMLPSPERFDALDLYDPANWPAAAPKPRPGLLEEVAAAREKLADPDDRFVLVAGVNQMTVVGLERTDADFLYLETERGDGTVPLDFARLPDVPTYYIEDTHTGLIGNALVASAVADLISTGKTDQLAAEWSPPERAAAAVRKSDSELRVERADGRRGAALTERERRHVLATVMGPAPAAPPVVTLPVAAAAAAAAQPQAGPLPPAPASLRGVVVGRRRQHRLDIVLAHGSITDVRAHAYVLGKFEEVKPTGAAKVLDEKLDGAISELVGRRMFSSAVGQVFMLPTASQPLWADVVAFAGLGHVDQFTDQAQRAVAGNVIRTMLRAGLDEFATVLFGAGSVRDPGAVLRNLLAGFFDGLRDADRDRRFRRIVLCEWDEQRYAEMREELFRLSGSALFEDVEVTFDELALPRPRASERAEVAAVRRRAYLYARHVSGTARKAGFDFSLLSADGPAAAPAEVQPYDPKELRDLLDEIGKPGFDADRFGPRLEAVVMAPPFRQFLCRQDLRGQHLVVVHDALAARVPWEVLRCGDHVPALEGGVSRRYLAGNLSIAKWLEQRRFGATFDLLLVVDPTEDLPGAADEGDVVRGLVQDVLGVTVKELRGKEATYDALRREFQSGAYDAVHYAGHAAFDEAHPGRSGIRCAGGRTLSGEDLAGLGNLPALVFFNACESARVRKVPEREQLRDSTAFAEAFLRGGVAQFLGTYWPVGDDAAEAFAKTFYGDVVRGKPVGDALLEGRRAVRALKSNDWADYIHYGDPDFALKHER